MRCVDFRLLRIVALVVVVVRIQLVRVIIVVGLIGIIVRIVLIRIIIKLRLTMRVARYTTALSHDFTSLVDH